MDPKTKRLLKLHALGMAYLAMAVLLVSVAIWRIKTGVYMEG